MTDHVDLNAEQLDAVIADTLPRAPHLAVVLRAMKAGKIRYVELANGRTARVLGPRQDLPPLLLVVDPGGRGPAHFGAEFMARTCRRVCGVTIVVDQHLQPDDLAYAAATDHVIARQQPVLLVETHRSAVREWVGLAYAAGKAEGDVVVITADPDQPDGLTQMTLDELAKVPRRRGRCIEAAARAGDGDTCGDCGDRGRGLESWAPGGRKRAGQLRVTPRF